MQLSTAGVGKPLLSLVKVGKRFGDAWAIVEASLRVRLGDSVLILGANGTGKTTLLRIMAGLVQPSRGRVEVNCPQHDPKACLGYVGHTPILYPEMTPEENLRYFSALYGMGDPNLRDQPAWRMLGLSTVGGKRVKQLSFGWRKRVDIARATIHRPRVLLLDEPFTGLDDEGRETLLRLLTRLSREGVALVMASPRWEEEYGALRPRVFRMAGGRLVEDEGAS